MNQTPLDSPLHFEPGADERPAGEWMERYWSETAPWTKILAYVTWAYAGLNILFSGLIAALLSQPGPHNLGQAAGALLWNAPIVTLGYFSFKFGKELERALAENDQWRLQSAFRHLYRFLIMGLILAIFWLILNFFQWRSFILLPQVQGLDTYETEIPLQTE